MPGGGGLRGLAMMNAMRQRALAAGGGRGRGFAGTGALDMNSESTPPPTDTTPFSTVSNQNINWGNRPEFRTGRNNAPRAGVFGLGYTAGMPVGSVNSRGGIFSGFMNGLPVFQAQSVAGNYGSAYSGGGGMFGSGTSAWGGGGISGNSGAGYSPGVGFGSYPSVGLISQKHL